MNVALKRAAGYPVEPLLDRPGPTVTMRDRVRMGMPHLNFGGLSETWLLKEMGHRHWLMLADLAQRDVPDFRDADGTPIYAAFCAVVIRDADFGSVMEHDELTISSELGRISRTQFASLHRLTRNSAPCGRVELSSVFVRRSEPGKNRSIARVAVDGLPPPWAHPDLGYAAGVAAGLRSDRWSEHFGFMRNEAEEGFGRVFDPCPSQDFNGARFLYFSSFAAFADRTEWELLRPPERLRTRARDIVYYGNIEPGEKVVVTIASARRGMHDLTYWCRITRECDGTKVADVFTSKANDRLRPF